MFNSNKVQLESIFNNWNLENYHLNHTVDIIHWLNNVNNIPFLKATRVKDNEVKVWNDEFAIIVPIKTTLNSLRERVSSCTAGSSEACDKIVEYLDKKVP